MTGRDFLGQALIRRRPTQCGCKQEGDQGGSSDWNSPFEPLPPGQSWSVGALGRGSVLVFGAQGCANARLQLRRSFEIEVRRFEGGAQGAEVLISLRAGWATAQMMFDLGTAN